MLVRMQRQINPATLLLGMGIFSYTKEGFTKLNIEAKHVAVISFTSVVYPKEMSKLKTYTYSHVY